MLHFLILEDDALTLSHITALIARLEEEFGVEIEITVLSSYSEVQELVNPTSRKKYDLILLDGDCKRGASFHVLDIEGFGADKIISISSVPEWNTQARERGVESVVFKQYSDLDSFSAELYKELSRKLEGCLEGKV